MQFEEDYNGFELSNGWLAGFKTCNGLAKQRAAGDAGSTHQNPRNLRQVLRKPMTLFYKTLVHGALRPGLVRCDVPLSS